MSNWSQVRNAILHRQKIGRKLGEHMRVETRPPDGLMSFPVKVVDDETRRLIDEAVEKRG